MRQASVSQLLIRDPIVGRGAVLIGPQLRSWDSTSCEPPLQAAYAYMRIVERREAEIDSLLKYLSSEATGGFQYITKYGVYRAWEFFPRRSVAVDGWERGGDALRPSQDFFHSTTEAPNSFKVHSRFTLRWVSRRLCVFFLFRLSQQL